MKYTRLGNSDLNVSRICMGCMGFGDPGRGQHSWTIDEEHTREIIRRGLELGVNFYDTAIAYQSGIGSLVLSLFLVLGSYDATLAAATPSMRYSIYAFSNYFPVAINLIMFLIFRRSGRRSKPAEPDSRLNKKRRKRS